MKILMDQKNRQPIKRNLVETEKEILVEAIENGNDEKIIEFINIMENVDQEVHKHQNNIFFGTILTFSCEHGRIKIVRYLIESGANLNKIDFYEASPLMKASNYGHIEICQMLIEAGADVSFTNDYGHSALSMTAIHYHIEIFELLISSEIDIEKCGGGTIIAACISDNFTIVERLIELGVNVNSVHSENGYTSLHFLCEDNKFELIKILMNNDADDTILNNDGKTPIELTENEEIKKFITNYNSTKYVLK